jgi:hypothetical protein
MGRTDEKVGTNKKLRWLGITPDITASGVEEALEGALGTLEADLSLLPVPRRDPKPQRIGARDSGHSAEDANSTATQP